MSGLDQPVALVEKFYSVQGEGANAGRAALFVRFAGCNLDCHFADGSVCDTPWQKAKEKLTVGHLVDWIDDTAHGLPEAPMIIFTGGEPTMAPAMPTLVRVLKPYYYLAIESNGTNWRDYLEDLDWVVVSPKDRIDHGKPLGSPALDSRVMDFEPHEYRYVITGRHDTIPPWLPGQTHYLSPALIADGSGTEHLRGDAPRFADGAVDRCLEIIGRDPRWRLSLQTHKWIRVR